MSSLAKLVQETLPEAGEECVPLEATSHHGYVPLIRDGMRNLGLTNRKLATRTGIGRRRINTLLAAEQAQLPGNDSITLAELKSILHALEIDFLQAVVRVELVRDLELLLDNRLSSAISMVGELCKELPAILLESLQKIDGLDGTEIRLEWAETLINFIVSKVTLGVTQTIVRREGRTALGS
jgi:hypothetical protein